MQLSIPRDQLLNPTPPRIFLCNTARKRFGQLPATNVNLNAKWRQYSELTFEIQRTYVDLIDGETKVHPLYDKVEAPRNVLVEGYGLFCLQDIDDTSSDNDIKSVSAFSAEYATSNKYLTNFHINTGEIDSAEVLFNEKTFGLDYNTDRDSFYKFASGAFDPYESYYKRQYTDNESYTYERIQISNEDEYNKIISDSNKTDAQLSEKLYVKKFPNVQFFNDNEERHGLSLLHLVFEYLPDWKIVHVDQSLWHKERKFSEDRVSVYDFLSTTVSETFGCTFVWDSLRGEVRVYEEVEDDEIENETSTRWETDVYISKNNLASECKVSYSSDNIKTKLVVTGSDDLDIREVNLGRNEIMDLSFYHTEDWMEQDLFEKYDDYLAEVQEAQTGLDSYGFISKKYPTSYPDAMQGWVSANNKYHDLMHAIPSEENVLLIGDEFKKLFCAYTPINSAYAKDVIIDGNSVKAIETLYHDPQCTIPVTDMKDGTTHIVQGYKLTYSLNNPPTWNVGDSMIPNSKNALIKKLNQYHVDEDTQLNKNDNILLKIKNSASDVATIRIYNSAYDLAVNYEAYNNYYSKKDNTYTKIRIVDDEDFANTKANLNGEIYTNHYQIHTAIYRASEGVSGDSGTYELNDWLAGNLTAEEMGFIKYKNGSEIVRDDNGNAIPDYTVSYIGTMGAYFVLAKDEIVVDDNGALQISQDYLNKCGVNLLKEKHDIYTKLFQTQTEAMLSQEKHQCIIQDEQPVGTYKAGTRWLDSDDPNATLREYRAADSSTNPPTNAGWYVVTDAETNAPVNPTDEELYNYENYQRYLDNFNKLKAVQAALSEKERQATYCLDGYQVDDTSIKWKTMDDGSSIPENFEVIAQRHLDSIKPGYSCTGQLVRSKPWILYAFTTSYDPVTYEKNTKPYKAVEQYYIKSYYIATAISNHEDFNKYDGSTETKTLYILESQHPNVYKKNTETYGADIQYYIKLSAYVYTPITIDSEDVFKKYAGTTNESTLYIISKGHTFAVYIKDNEPYVAYLHSQGAYQMIMDNIRMQTEMSTYFTPDQWIRLSPLIKEDEYNDSNFLLTGYESEEERISIAKELMEAATKELKTLCKPSLEFSMTMANILVLPEFEPLVEYFQLGNFIKVEIRDDYIRRTRLLEVNINFDDMSDFSATFGNLVSVKSEIDKHAELLSQAVTAGKQVAKSGNKVMKSVEKTNKLETDIANGLKDMALAIGGASGQAISWDDTGMHFRKYKEGSTTEFEPEEIAIINNSLVATNDSWLTSKAAFGKYTIDGEERWGPIAEYVTAQIIEGKDIIGGSLRIGGKEDSKGTFIVNEDGSVQILGPEGNEMYAGKALETTYQYQTRLTYSGPTIFTDINHECIITCHVYDTYKPIGEKGIEDQEITTAVISNGGTFTWNRALSGSNTNWTPTLVSGQPNVVKVKQEDIERNAQFDCIVEFDETKLNIQGGASE